MAGAVAFSEVSCVRLGVDVLPHSIPPSLLW